MNGWSVHQQVPGLCHSHDTEVGRHCDASCMPHDSEERIFTDDGHKGLEESGIEICAEGQRPREVNVATANLQ